MRFGNHSKSDRREILSGGFMSLPINRDEQGILVLLKYDRGLRRVLGNLVLVICSLAGWLYLSS